MRKYKTVVIDPPWELNTMSPKFCKSPIDADLPYNTLSDNALYNFPIYKYADKECDLFLWTTKAKLHLSFHLFVRWGLKFGNLLVWNKKNGICSNGFHNTLEYVLYGYKGKSGISFTKPLETYFEAKRTKHSEKPSLFYSMIRERTKEPRIDIFARKRHYGFDAYGDQVETKMDVPLHLFR